MEFRNWLKLDNLLPIVLCSIYIFVLLLYFRAVSLGLALLVILLIFMFIFRKPREADRSKFNWKIIFKSSFIGLLTSGILYGFLSILSYAGFDLLSKALFFPFFPAFESNSGDGGLALLFLVPLYGILAGTVVGYIVASLTKEYKIKRSLFRKGGIYAIFTVLVWMFISLIQPLNGTSDSFNEPTFIRETICEVGQGCRYELFELCEFGDWSYYPYPEKSRQDFNSYPQVPIEQLPEDTTYLCETYENPSVTAEDLVDGKCVWVNGRGETAHYDPFIDPKYAGYSVKEEIIYENGDLCGEIGSIRYRTRCKC